MKRLLALVAITGCTYNPEAFEADVDAELCRLYVCRGIYDDVDQCMEADNGRSDWESCEFDAATARDCVDAYEALECPATLIELQEPAICADVYTCSDPGA